MFNKDKHEQHRANLQKENDAYDGEIADLEQKIETMLDMATKTTSNRVAKRLEEYEKKIEVLKASKETNEQELATLKPQIMEFSELQDMMKHVKQDRAFRAELAAKIQAKVSKMYVASAGSFPLLGQAAPQVDADEEVDISNIDPSDSRLHNRWFGIRFRNDAIEIKTVAPAGRAIVPLSIMMLDT
jgi:hypothetical protein